MQRPLHSFVCAGLILALTVPFALAQDQSDAQRRRRHLPGGAAAPFQSFPGNNLSFQPPPPPGFPPPTGGFPTLPPGTPMNPALAPLPGEAINILFEARLTKGGAVPRQGIKWRIFSGKPESDGTFVMVAEGNEGTFVAPLRPGPYIVTVTLGTLVQSRAVDIGRDSRREEFLLNAGGLKLAGLAGGKALPATDLSVDVFQGSFLDAGEPKPVLRQARAGEVLILPAGTYNVVSTWGDANATIRADVKVQAGKLTEASMNHRAATVNLRLVSPQGNAAIANTTWSVLTPGGDVIKEAIGTFPSVVLAEGEYLAIARYEGKVYNKKFKIDPGTDLDVDIVAQ